MIQYTGATIITGQVSGDASDILVAMHKIMLQAGWVDAKILPAQARILNATFPLQNDSVTTFADKTDTISLLAGSKDFTAKFGTLEGCNSALPGGADINVEGPIGTINIDLQNIAAALGSGPYFTFARLDTSDPQYPGYGPIAVLNAKAEGGAGNKAGIFIEDGSWAVTKPAAGGGWIMRTAPDELLATTGVQIWAPDGVTLTMNVVDSSNNIVGPDFILDTAATYQIAASPLWMVIWSPFSNSSEQFFYHGLLYQQPWSQGTTGTPTPAITMANRGSIFALDQDYWVSNIELGSFGRLPFSSDSNPGFLRFVQPLYLVGGYPIQNSANCFGESDPMVGFGEGRYTTPKVQGMLYDAILVHNNFGLETRGVIDGHLFICVASQANNTGAGFASISPQSVSLWISLGMFTGSFF